MRIRCQYNTPSCFRACAFVPLVSTLASRGCCAVRAASQAPGRWRGVANRGRSRFAAPGLTASDAMLASSLRAAHGAAAVCNRAQPRST